MTSSVARLIIAITIFSVPLNARASDVTIIANPSVKANAISPDDLRNVYLQERNSLSDGTHVEPVLKKGGAAHDSFLRQYLDISADGLQTYYRTLVFTGRGSMPRTLGSDAEVVAYVARIKGAIGYVSPDADTAGVKILPVQYRADQARRTLLIRIEPVYPQTLQQMHIGGTVRLSISISPQGTVETAVLLGGNPILAESAITAVKQWVFAVDRSRTRMEVSIPFDPQR